jgi:hypothetical protein
MDGDQQCYRHHGTQDFRSSIPHPIARDCPRSGFAWDLFLFWKLQGRARCGRGDSVLGYSNDHNPSLC